LRAGELRCAGRVLYAGSVADDVSCRCGWCGDDPVYVAYHDTEWGVPLRDDQALFALLVLEGAQAGLSWITILRRRDGYRAAYDGFDPDRIARWSDDRLDELAGDPRIIRNRAKIRSARQNARAYLALRDEAGSFSDLVWSFVDHTPLVNTWRDGAQVPATTGTAKRLSNELRRCGFSFVGPTISYAFMQSAGLVNDHLVSCFRWSTASAETR
jgi:DNA-3-methyladenine glycosylase I